MLSIAVSLLGLTRLLFYPNLLAPQRDGNNHLVRLVAKKQAVALVTVEMDSCRWNRVSQMLQTTDDAVDVVILYDGNPPEVPDTMGNVSRLVLLPQTSSPEWWGHFSQRLDGSFTHSGTSKQAFLQFLIGNPEYELAWHVEDDVEYTGHWGKLLRLLAPAFQDLVTCYLDVDLNSDSPWLQKDVARTCYSKPGVRCSDDERLKGRLTKVRWPLLGMSRRLAQTIAQEFNSSTGVRGHHESTTGTICRLRNWCAMSSIPSVLLGRFALDGYGPYQKGFFQQLTNGSNASLDTLRAWARLGVQGGVRSNRLYHPVKCPARQDGGEQTEFQRTEYNKPQTETINYNGTDDGTEPCSGVELSTVQQQVLVKDAMGMQTDTDMAASQDGDNGAVLEDLGVAVCITGQLARLELRSKVENLLQPLKKYGGVGVFTVLEQASGSPVFSRVDDFTPDGCNDEPSAPSLELDGELGTFLVESKVVEHVAANVSLERWPSFRRDDIDFKGNWEKRAVNLQHLFTAHEHVATCAGMIEAHEQREGGRYRALIRVRDNTLVVQPFEISTLGSSFSQLAVHVKECSGWGGLNDKVMLAPRELLHAFTATANAMCRQNEGELSDLSSSLADSFNAEQMLMFSLDQAAVPYARVSAEELPMVDGRCVGIEESNSTTSNGSNVLRRKQWCLLGDYKDCAPSELDQARFPSCPTDALSTESSEEQNLKEHEYPELFGRK